MIIATVQLTAPVKQLRQLRLRKKWTQRECAAKLGVTYSALRSWERDGRKPGTAFLRNHINQFIKRHEKSIPSAARSDA